MFLTIGLVVAAMFLVGVYVRLVNLNHTLDAVSREIQEVQTANAELKDKLFVLWDGDRVESLAAERNLVKENNPRYFYLRLPGEPVALERR